MAQREPLSFRVEDETAEAVEAFRQRHGYDNKSEAVAQLVEVGLREQRNPLVWRFKDRVVEWINLLSIAAVVLFVLGVTTAIIAPIDGMIAAFFLLTLASLLLAGFETVRVAAGMNEIGVRVRYALAQVVGRV